MNLPRLRSLFGIMLSLLLPYSGVAQRSKADSSALAASVALVRQHYARTLIADSRLLTGTEYIDYTKPRTSGHQFLQAFTPQVGTVDYQGIHYPNVPLLYDIRRDQLVLADMGSVTRIQLLANQIGQFTLADRRFVRLVADSAAQALLPTGFYEQLLSGSATVLARRTKKVVNESSLQKVGYRYQEESQLFVRKGSAVAPISNLKSILRLLPDKRAELSKYARATGLRFQKDQREVSAVRLVAYYNTLAP